MNGKSQGAHRVAWTLAVGPIPDGMHVLHHCDNPPCCNPAHLFLGTNFDNIADREAKGRAGRHDGTKNGRAKLTDADVLTIRRRYIAGERTKLLASEYGVHVRNIRRAIRGESFPNANYDALTPEPNPPVREEKNV